MTAEVTRDFDAGAARYDLLVGLNPGYHRHLNAAARALADAVPSAGSLLDLGCGSGASTRALLRVFGDGVAVTGVDASSGMLAQAQAKQWPDSVRFVQARAGELGALRDTQLREVLAAPDGSASIPDGLAESSTDRGGDVAELGDVVDLGAAASSAGILESEVDGLLAAYLFRNVPADQRDAALADTFEALRPGGALVVLEYSVAGNRRAESLWRSVCRTVILPLAKLTGGNPDLYRYLERSVLEFDTVDAFQARLGRAGFVEVESSTVSGWQRGILHIVRARRPE